MYKYSKFQDDESYWPGILLHNLTELHNEVDDLDFQ